MISELIENELARKLSKIKKDADLPSVGCKI